MKKGQWVEGKGQVSIFSVFCLLLSVFCPSCGYTTKSLLPAHIKTIYVENFKNSIDLTTEISNKRPYTLYKPGLENEITRGIIDRFIFDGNLKVVKSRDGADSILSGELLEYVKEPLRYNESEDVTEYKVRVVASVKFFDQRDGKIIWRGGRFSGESSQRTQGALQKSEDVVKDEAVADLARRVVEKTIEVW